MLSFMLILGVGYLSFTYVFQPYFQEKSVLEERKELLSARLGFLSLVETGLGNLEKQMETASFIKESLEENLTYQRETPLFLQMIREWAKEEGLEIYELRPRDVVKKDFFSILPLDLSFRGTYEGIILFMDHLFKTDYPIRVNSLSLVFDGLNEEEERFVPLIRMNLSLNLYLKRDEGGVVVGFRVF